MKKRKRFSDIEAQFNTAYVPQGGYETGITEQVFAAKFGNMATRWPHIEDLMIGVFTELLGGDASLPTRQIYRSIISPQSRIKVLRSLLQRTELNQRKDPIYDEVIDEFSSLNDQRNTYLHGLWHTHESGRVFFIEASQDEMSIFQNREVHLNEIDEFIDRLDALENRIANIMDGEQVVRDANAS
jgi:hypothetical protein